MQAIPIFVVSLARATERRATITAHLRGLGLDFTLMDAVDGRAMSEAERQALSPPGVEWHPGVVGCYMSHLQIYEKMLTESIEIALILEDDAELNPEFSPALHAGLASKEFDYCFLDGHPQNPDGAIYYDASDSIQLYGKFRANRTHAGLGGTHAYLITRAAAERRMAHALPIIQPIDVYAHLPYRPRFYAMIRPNAGAWTSEHGLVSYTKAEGDRPTATNLAWLRRTLIFYRVRNAIHPEMIRRRIRKWQMLKSGVLPASGRWRPMPSGRFLPR